MTSSPQLHSMSKLMAELRSSSTLKRRRAPNRSSPTPEEHSADDPPKRAKTESPVEVNLQPKVNTSRYRLIESECESPYDELSALGFHGAAKNLVRLHPAAASDDKECTQTKDLVAAWTPLYLPSCKFDIDERIDYRECSTTKIDEGTFCEVHVDRARAGHVVMKARYTFSGSTDVESEDAATYEHYANTLDSAVRIRAASFPRLEPRWAAVPHAFTIVVEKHTNCVTFIFFAVRYTPLCRYRIDDLESRKKLMWSLVVSAWFVENEAGLAHRDIKPANVLVTCDGRAVLSDFGSSRPLGCSGNPSYYMNPPWMEPNELTSLTTATRHVWTAGCSTYAIGMLMLWMWWGECRFNLMFPQQRQKRWVEAVISDRKSKYNKKFYSMYEKAARFRGPGAGFETAAFMLAHPCTDKRGSLMFIERSLRPLSEAALLEIPRTLQRSGDFM